jgi:addiction module RelB/DinJ family antitoxin
MANVIINFQTDKETKEQAQKIASDLGVSLSSVLNMYLKHFVRTKQLNVKIEDNQKTEEKKVFSESDDVLKFLK